MNVYYDLPITSDFEDEFNRKEHARRVANIINQVECESSFVIGVSGVWGSGKSSFMNLLEENLHENEASCPSARSLGECKKPPIIIRFNPWMIGNREQLLAALFREVASCIDNSQIIEDEKKEKIATSVKEYASLLGTPISLLAGVGTDLIIPGSSNFVRPSVKGILSHFREKKKQNADYGGLCETRKKLNDDLAQLECPVVLFIDDIDRLDASEIKEIFKLVNLTASFPHFVYVLSYDQSVVEAALDDVQGISGHDYLEKIIQLPVSLPLLSSDQVRKKLNGVLNGYLSMLRTYDLDGTDEFNRLADLVETQLQRSIQTPRQFIRFANTLNLNFAIVGEEMCPTDLVAISAIQLMYPHLYQWIWLMRDHLCGNTFVAHFDHNAMAREEIVSSLCRVAMQDGLEKDQAEHYITLLFPIYKKIANPKSFASNDGLKSRGRICEQRILERLYSSGEAERITRIDFHEALFSQSLDKVIYLVHECVQHGYLRIFLDYLEGESLSIPERQLKEAIIQLFGVLGESEETDSFWGESIDTVIARYVQRILITRFGPESSDWLVDALKNFPFDKAIRLIWFVRNERLAREESSPRGAALSKAGYERLVQKFIFSVHNDLEFAMLQADFPCLPLYAVVCEEENKIDIWEADAQRIKASPKLTAIANTYRLSRSRGVDGVSFELSKGEDRLISFDVSVKELKVYFNEDWFFVLPECYQQELAALYLLLADETKERVRASEAKLFLEQHKPH